MSSERTARRDYFSSHASQALVHLWQCSSSPADCSDPLLGCAHLTDATWKCVRNRHVAARPFNPRRNSMCIHKTSWRACHLTPLWAAVCPLRNKVPDPKRAALSLYRFRDSLKLPRQTRVCPLLLRAAGAAGILAQACTVKAKPWFTSNTHPSVIHVTNINQMPSSSASAENDGLPLLYTKQRENEI